MVRRSRAWVAAVARRKVVRMQLQQIIFIAAIIGVFYFLIIRPQQKRQKDQASLMSSLKPGAEIQTIGGIFGTIVSMDGDRALIRVADGSEFEIAKRAIGQVVSSVAVDADDDDDDADDDAADQLEDATSEHEDAASDAEAVKSGADSEDV